MPYNIKLTERAKELRKNMTPAKEKIWYEVLQNKSFENLGFLRQRPIDNFIVDFYCAELKLVLEIDGDVHAEQEEYDTERTSVLEGYGLKVIRIQNRDILENISGVYEMLFQAVESRKEEIPQRGFTREEIRKHIREQKEKEFIKLILSAYKAESVDSFNTFVGKKRDRLVAVGQIDTPVTSDFLERVIVECKEKKITKADVLGFDYEMGLDFESAKKLGIDLQFKVIPREVFDKRAVEKGQVKFYDVAYIEVKPILRGRRNVNEVAVELTDFSVFYNQDNTGEVEEKLQSGGNKIIIENGQVIKISKDKKTDIIEREVLTKKWSDWIDYWAVDFDFASKKEIVRVIDEKTGEEKEEWTGGYIFENEWQSFRTKKDRSIELTSAFKDAQKCKTKIAVKVIDIFGNDTTKVIEVSIYSQPKTNGIIL